MAETRQGFVTGFLHIKLLFQSDQEESQVNIDGEVGIEITTSREEMKGKEERQVNNIRERCDLRPVNART